MTKDPTVHPGRLDLARWPDRITVLVIRYLSLGGCVAVSTLFRTAHPTFLSAFLAFFIVVAAPYALWLARRAEGRRLARVQFLVDHGLLMALIVYSGGWESPYWLLFPVAILSAGVYRSPLKSLALGAASAVVYGGAVWGATWIASGVVPWSLWAARGFLFLLFGLLASGLVTWCRVRESGVDLGMVGHHLLQRVQVGVLVLDEDDMIIQANPAACALLAAEERMIIGVNFNAFRADDTSMEPRHLLRTEALHLKKVDGTEFPAFYKKAELDLPPELNAELEATGVVRPRIVSFVDVSEALQATSDLFKAEHLEIVDNLLNTMADGIRNPVTGITSAVQVLEKIEGRKDRFSPEEREAQRREMFNHILHEANRLDKIIEYVVLHPHITPAKFRELFDSLRHPFDAEDDPSSSRT